MTKIYKLLSVLILFCTVSLEVNAQRNFFNDIAESAIKNLPGKREIIPQKFRTTKMDINGIKSFLWSLASEKNINQSRSNASVLELPMPNGKTAKFRVWESSIQEPDLQAKFPEIKTFSGQGIDDPYATIRFDFTDFGFHAQIISAATGNIYIDPYKRGNKDYYISYFNRDNIKETNWHCETLPAAVTNGLGPITNVVPVGACRGTQLYTYRLAVACTGEYAIAVGGSTAALLHSAIVTTVNRVDGVYENEFAIRLVLIANNNLIEFLNPGTDPFTGNNNGNALINQSQSVIDANIGNANYDVGHTFSTGGGGLSGLGINCKTGQKAQSITGSPNPTGDGYDIDYVAHEMGHAFGCDHTFNSNASNCGGGNRNAATAYEVGSGTTIMAYAGICSTSGSQAGDNTQNHSDPYFHSVSFDEASVYVAGAGGSCPVKTNTGNTLPVITSMGTSGLTIPINTPFVLTGSATDADGDALTYDWEEWDLGPTTVWNGGNANTTSPLFKSQIPKTTGSRSFPSLAYILAGFPVNPPGIVGGLKGETLPTSARTMQFRLTVRDNRAGGGAVVTGGSGCSSFNTPFTVNVAGTTAFAVSSPNGGESYPGGSSQTITWDVAGTSIAPFNVTNVKISYSIDGGLTYPTILVASTPNDGSEMLTIPSGITTTARIKIEAIGNIFYDISNANFAVTIPANDFVFGTTTAATVSCPAATDPTVTIPTTVTGTFVTPIILTATAGVPAGTSVSFAPSTITPGNSAVATLNNAGTLSAGTYTVTVTGTAGTTVHTTTITFIISAGTAPTITTQPASIAVCAPAAATFTVASSTPGVIYQWQSAPSATGTFTNISAANTATYTTGATSGLNGAVYHVIIFTQCGTVTSSNATLTVNIAAAITTQPIDQSACTGNTATFTAAATGTGVTYQWQSSATLAGTYTNVTVGTGGTTNSYTTEALTVSTDRFYRVIVTTTACPAVINSNIATLTTSVTTAINTQPTTQIVCAPGAAVFAVAALGTGATYQWQVSTAATPASFVNVTSGTGGTTDTYNTGITTGSMSGNSYRVIVTGSCNTVISNAVLLTVNTAPAISTAPQAVTICSGSDAVFNVSATGTALNYVWQSATTLGGTYTAVAGAPSSSTLTIPAATFALNGTYYRVVISGTCTPPVTSTPVLLTVNTPINININAVDASVCYTAAGPNNSSFNVAATGTSASYQWQVSADGQSYSNIGNSTLYSGATTNTLNLTGITLTMNGYKYRVLVSGTCTPAGVLSNAVTLTVLNPVVINSNPVDVVTCAGNTANFTVDASGPALSYQWLYSTDGISYTTVPNAAPFTGTATATLSVANLATTFNNYLFKVIVTGTPCGILTSTAAKLTVNENPSVALSLTSYSSITPSVRTSLQTMVSPVGNYTYQYIRDGIATNLSGPTVPLNVDLLGTYQVIATNTTTGCFSKSNAVTVKDSASNQLFVYPNPSSGVFQVRYYNQGNPTPSTERTLIIFDSKGAKVYSKRYPIDAPYDKMNVNISNAQHGLYFIELRDANGKRIASGKVTLQ